MTQQLSKTKENAKQEEQQLARTQRQELKAELANNFANRPRGPRDRRRMITFVILGIIALLAGIFGLLVLLPSPAQQPTGGVAVGTGALAFNLPLYAGGRNGTVAAAH